LVNVKSMRRFVATITPFGLGGGGFRAGCFVIPPSSGEEKTVSEGLKKVLV